MREVMAARGSVPDAQQRNISEGKPLVLRLKLWHSAQGGQSQMNGVE